jgi:hypothetical protein
MKMKNIARIPMIASVPRAATPTFVNVLAVLILSIIF